MFVTYYSNNEKTQNHNYCEIHNIAYDPNLSSECEECIKEEFKSLDEISLETRIKIVKDGYQK